MAMLADVLPVTRRGEGMGWYGVVYTATNVYAPWLGLAVADALGLPAFFVLNGAVLLACAAVSWLVHEERRPAPAEAPPGPMLNRSAVLPTASFMSLAITYSALPAFLVLYARQRDLGNAGAFFFVLGLALVAARWFGGAAADRFGRTAVIIPGFIVTATSMALLALAPGPAAFYASAIIFGLGFGLGHTGLTILTVDRAPPAERGAAMATFAIAWDVGTLGAFALGFVADAISLQALFAVAAVLPLVSLVGFVAARRRG
jgi:MFS family permease